MFAARANKKTAAIVAGYSKKIESGKELKSIAGIGKGSQDKVRTSAKTHSVLCVECCAMWAVLCVECCAMWAVLCGLCYVGCVCCAMWAVLCVARAHKTRSAQPQ